MKAAWTCESRDLPLPPQNRRSATQRISGFLHGGDQQASLSAAVQRSEEPQKLLSGSLTWKPQQEAACCVCSGGPGRGSVPPSPCYSSEDVISCQLTRSVQCAHQKPITVLRAAAGRVVTGSQDHTVRVRTSSRFFRRSRTGNAISSSDFRFTVWRIRAASSPCRVTLEESQPFTSTRSASCFTIRAPARRRLKKKK